jgi:hypothetical protein
MSAGRRGIPWRATYPDHVPVRRARTDRHNHPAREADRPPGHPAIIGPEHAVPVGATPRAPVNQRIRGQACGAATDPMRWSAGASFNVYDDDLAVGRNQYQHHHLPS